MAINYRSGEEFMSEMRENGTHVTDAFNRFTSAETAKWWIINKEITGGDSIQVYEVVLPRFESKTTLDSFGELTSNGTITVEPVTVELRNNTASVIAMNMLTTGTNLATVTIERIANVQNNKIVIQTFKFVNCHLTSWGQRDDHVWLSFSFEEVENTRNAYAQDGTRLGNVVSLFNVTEIESKQIGG